MSKRSTRAKKRASRKSRRFAASAAQSGLVLSAAEVEFQAADGEGPVPVEIVAYNGDVMTVPGFGPVVVDLASTKLASSITLLSDHDTSRKGVVGAATGRIDDGRLVVAGQLSRKSDAANQIIGLHQDGVKWQASIGLRLENATRTRVRPGQSIEANGRTITAGAKGFTLIQGGVAHETTITAFGCDSQTTVSIAAGHQLDTEDDMGFAAWLTERGFSEADLSDQQRETLHAMFTADSSGDDPAPDPTSAPRQPDSSAAVAEFRASMAGEAERCNEINALCAQYGVETITDNGSEVKLAAHAIRNGWTVEQAELAALRASRPSAPSQNGHQSASTQVLEAAVLVAGGYDESVAAEEYGDEVMQAAHTRFRASIGLQQFLLEAAWANGWQGRSFRGNERDVLRAAFSNHTVSGILSNTANKFIRVGFDSVESSWMDIAATRPVTDFKQITTYTLTGDMQYEQVGPDGELKHAKAGEETYTNQADTYGKIFSLTRKDMLNDDLGAVSQVRRRLGRGAALKLNDVFWTEFLDDATFFASGNNNYFDGASSTLQSSSLQTAVQKFRDQTDPDGKPLGVEPAILLVPTALEVDADELYVSTTNNTGGSSTKAKVPNRNTFAGKYRPVVSSYIGNSSYTGSSTTAWYLLADPNDMPVIEVAFLNGRQRPTVESTDANFNTLGIQFRGYHDFGVNKQEHRGGVKSKGAA